MYVTTVPVIDRLIAERRLEHGEPIDHPAVQGIEDWLDRLDGSLVTLGEVLDEAELFVGDVRDAFEAVSDLLNGSALL